MTLRNLILVSALALFACKKNGGGASTGGQTGTPKPIGEQLYNPGDSTGASTALGVSLDPSGNIIVSGFKGLMNSTIAAISGYPLRLTVDFRTLKTLSQAAPLTNDYGMALQSRQSGNFIYTVITLSNSYGNQLINQIKVIKTDTSNHIIWQVTKDSVTSVTGLTLLSNGNLLIQGNYGNDLTGSTNALVLLSMDANGNTVFNRQYTGQYFGSSVDMIEESNDIAFVGLSPTFLGYGVGIPFPYILTPTLVKIDFMGNVLSSKWLSNFIITGSWHYFPSFRLAKNAAGGYLLTTVSVDTAGGAVDENFFLKLLQPDGSVRDSADLSLSGSAGPFQVLSVLQAPTGNIYVLICLDNGSDWVPQIIEYDSKGQYVKDVALPLGRFPVGMLQTKDNDLVVVQSYSAVNGISIMKLDGNLQPL